MPTTVFIIQIHKPHPLYAALGTSTLGDTKSYPDEGRRCILFLTRATWSVVAALSERATCVEAKLEHATAEEHRVDSSPNHLAGSFPNAHRRDTLVASCAQKHERREAEPAYTSHATVHRQYYEAWRRLVWSSGTHTMCECLAGFLVSLGAKMMNNGDGGVIHRVLPSAEGPRA